MKLFLYLFLVFSFNCILLTQVFGIDEGLAKKEGVQIGGDSVGNGGDAIMCSTKLPYFTMDGFYVLDYVLASSQRGLQIVPVNTLKVSLDRIRRLLSKNIRKSFDPILVSFDSFVASINKSPSLGAWDSYFLNTSSRIWLAKGTLPIVANDFVKKIPLSCQFNRKYGLFDQVVVRHRRGQVVEYEFEEQIVSSFFIDHPLQASFLLIHEWLWDFYEDKTFGAQRVRKANAFLHSRSAETISSTEFFERVFQVEPDEESMESLSAM